MRRGLLYKEAAVATALIFFLFLIIRFFPFSFELLKPFKQEVNDFDIYDLYYSGRNIGKNTRDSNIVLVEVGHSREAIVHQLDIIRKCRPAVTGVDILFPGNSSDTISDLLLKEISLRNDSIIWASQFDTDSGGNLIHTFSYFDTQQLQKRTGYINFTGNKYSVTRTLRPFLTFEQNEFSSFATRIVEQYDPGKYELLKKRKNKFETINYTGNLESYTSFSADSLNYYYKTGQLENKIRNKIVLVGVLHRHEPFVLEDLHFTPLNEKFSGRSNPDMYGVVIHANIISMILNNQYIKTKSIAFSNILSLLLTYLFTLFILSRYRRKAHPFHFGFILLQLLVICLLTFLFLLLFSEYRIKIPLLPIMITMVLSVEMIGVYRKLALWLNKKWSYSTIFLKSTSYEN